jgi:hypothetical protein
MQASAMSVVVAVQAGFSDHTPILDRDGHSFGSAGSAAVWPMLFGPLLI